MSWRSRAECGAAGDMAGRTNKAPGISAPELLQRSATRCGPLPHVNKLGEPNINAHTLQASAR